MRRLAFTLALLLLSPLAAEAVGPVVGPGCTARWTAPTTYADGVTPLTGVTTYDVYVVAGVQTIPAVPPTLTTVGTSVPICAGRAAGQWTVLVAGTNVPTPGAPPSVEGPMQSFPFVLSLAMSPGAVSNLTVAP